MTPPRSSPGTTAPTSREELLARAEHYINCNAAESGADVLIAELADALRAGVAQAQSSDRITQAIRDYCISLGSPVQLSSDGVERIYYSGISIVGLADAISTNAAPANRSTAKATANVGDNGERMGSEPAMGIVTGGSDPTPSMMSSTLHSPPAATIGDIPSEPRPPASAAMGHSAGGDPTPVCDTSCLAAARGGVICPEDSCDIETGVRPHSSKSRGGNDG